MLLLLLATRALADTDVVCDGDGARLTSGGDLLTLDDGSGASVPVTTFGQLLKWLALADARGNHTIRIRGEGCRTDSHESIADRTLTLICESDDGAPCEMPPLIVSRATFAATGIAVRNVVNVGPPDEWSTFFGGLAQDVGIFADSSELRLTGGELARADADRSVAVLALDSSVYLDAVAISWSGWHAIGSYARAADVTLGLTDCTVEGATYGAIVAGHVGVRGRVVEVALQGGLFSGNRSGFGSDLYAEANSVVINGTWFEDSFGGYAPVYVKTSNLTVSGAIFQATGGAEAATVKSVGASSVVIVDALTVASPLASKALVWVEGPAASFSLGGAYVDFAAPIVVDAQSSHVAEGVFLMGGSAPALVFRGGEAVVEHNRFCDGTGFSALPSGLFVANGADLDVRENLVQGVPLTGTSLVSTVGVVDDSESGGGVIQVHDNTFVQVGSPTLFDLQATGASIYNNLWRGPAPSIAQFDVSGDGWVAGWNLWEVTNSDVMVFPDGWGVDLFDSAGITDTFDPSDCWSTPTLQRDSHARGTGKQGTDIGAVDYGAEGEWGASRDTASGGDTADTADTDGRGDCHPVGQDRPDDGLDQNCSGDDASLSYSGGCGCDAGPPRAREASAVLVAIAAFARRRRGSR